MPDRTQFIAHAAQVKLSLGKQSKFHGSNFLSIESIGGFHELDTANGVEKYHCIYGSLAVTVSRPFGDGRNADRPADPPSTWTIRDSITGERYFEGHLVSNSHLVGVLILIAQGERKK